MYTGNRHLSPYVNIYVMICWFYKLENLLINIAPLAWMTILIGAPLLFYYKYNLMVTDSFISSFISYVPSVLIVSRLDTFHDMLCSPHAFATSFFVGFVFLLTVYWVSHLDFFLSTQGVTSGYLE